MAEYTADELAADSHDEKRLDKAEKAAERKAGKRKRKRPEFPPKTGKTGGRFSAVQGQSASPFPTALYPDNDGSRIAAGRWALLCLRGNGPPPERLPQDCSNGRPGVVSFAH